MKRRGRVKLKNKHIKIGLKVSEDIVRDARIEAERTCRTLSGFFEFAARAEINRSHQEMERRR